MEKLKTGTSPVSGLLSLFTLEDFERPSSNLLNHLLRFFVGATGRRHGSGMFGHHVGLGSFCDVGAVVVVGLRADYLHANRFADIFLAEKTADVAERVIRGIGAGAVGTRVI